MGTNDTAKQTLGKIRQDIRALKVQVKGTDAQMIFSSVLPVTGRVQAEVDAELQLASWLVSVPEFCVLHRAFFREYSLLGSDGIHLPRSGRRIFTSTLDELVNCAFN